MKLYHATNNKNAAGHIIMEGLRRQEFYGKLSGVRHVWLAKTKKQALRFGRHLFEVEVGGVVKHDDWQFIASSDIPANRIKYLGEKELTKW